MREKLSNRKRLATFRLAEWQDKLAVGQIQRKGTTSQIQGVHSWRAHDFVDIGLYKRRILDNSNVHLALLLSYDILNDVVYTCHLYSRY